MYEPTLSTEIICCLSGGPTSLEDLQLITNKPDFALQDALYSMMMQGKIVQQEGRYALGGEFQDMRPMPKSWWTKFFDWVFAPKSVVQCGGCGAEFPEKGIKNSRCRECNRFGC